MWHDALKKCPFMMIIQQLLGKRREGTQVVPSTNATYLIAVWNELMHASAPITAVGRSYVPSAEFDSKKTGVKVDIVCKGGTQWIRVNTQAYIFDEFQNQITD